MKKKEHIVPGYNMLQLYVYARGEIPWPLHCWSPNALQLSTQWWAPWLTHESSTIPMGKQLDHGSWWAPSDLSRNPQVREQKPGNKLTENKVSRKSWRFIHIQFKRSLISWYVWMTGSWIFYFKTYKVSSELALALPFAATVWVFLP